MALAIRESTDAPFSESGTQTNPFITVHNGRTATVIHKRLNVVVTELDDRTYTDIGLSVLPASGGDIVIKLYEDSPQVPTEAEWSSVPSRNTLELDDPPTALDIGAVVGYFWVRIEVPAGTSVQNITTNSFNLVYNEEA